MIQFHPIEHTDDMYWNEFVETYMEAFPADERRPLEDMCKITNTEKRFHPVTILNEEGDFIGIITYWMFTSFVYIEHFAFHPNVRSKGYGTQTLQEMKKMHTLPIVLEVEPPTITVNGNTVTDEIATRRIHFYERCGLEFYPQPYYQPPYSSELKGIDLHIMSTCAYSEPLFKEITRTLHREVYHYEEE